MRGLQNSILVATAVASSVLWACGGGSDGIDGTSCTVSQEDDGTAVIECTDGSSAEVKPGADGTDGVPGTDGEPGMDGAPGDSCQVSDGADGGVLVECEDGSSAVVPPGPTGPRGEAGLSNAVFGISGGGVKITVDSVTIPADRHPVAMLRVTDGDGVGLDVSNVLSAGEVSFRFTIAHVADEPSYNPAFDGPGVYQNYIDSSRTPGQPGDERGTGEWTLLDPATGEYEYRFALELPEDYDPAQTHVVSALAEREVDELTILGDDFYAFVPAGGTPTLREVSDDATCNTCHTRLTVHGNHRSGYQVCLTCHTQDAIDPDTGNSIAFAEMLHKIHIGADLPSNDPDNNEDPGSWGRESEDYYKIIGYSPEPIYFDHVHFPKPVNNCNSCHTGPDANWIDTRPSMEACGSCHDRTEFEFDPMTNAPEGWTRHPLGSKPPGTCPTCHTASFDTELCRPKPSTDTVADPDALDLCDGYTVHLNQFTDPDADTLTIDQFEVQVPADLDTTAVTVSFRARMGTNAGGPDDARPVTAAGDLVDLGIMVAGPNEDYANDARVDFTAGDDELVLSSLGSGVFSATFHATSGGPALTWTGLVGEVADPDANVDIENASFTFALRAGVLVWGGDPTETDRSGNVLYPDGKENGYTAYAVNPTVSAKYSPVTTEEPLVTRREVVSDAKCNSCHEDLRYSHHGGAYRSVKQCNMCHAPVIDRTGRPKRRLAFMVHEIHGQMYDAEPGYPGDARNCEQCHLEGTYDTALPAGVLPTTEQGGGITPPLTSFCTGCHGAPSTLAHAAVSTVGDYTTGFETDVIEACENCHGDGQSFGVDTAHATPWSE